MPKLKTRTKKPYIRKTPKAPALSLVTSAKRPSKAIAADDIFLKAANAIYKEGTKCVEDKLAGLRRNLHPSDARLSNTDALQIRTWVQALADGGLKAAERESIVDNIWRRFEAGNHEWRTHLAHIDGILAS